METSVLEKTTKDNGFLRSDVISSAAYTTAHFVVDFACAFLLFRMWSIKAVSSEDAWRFFLVYNLMAFGLEFFIGIFFNARTARLCSCIGFALIAIALILGFYAERIVLSAGAQGAQLQLYGAFGSFVSKFSYGSSVSLLPILILTSFVVIGIGNAFFHVGGGIDALSRNIGRYWRGGVFISSGSLGLAYGGILGRKIDSFSFCATLILVAFGTVIIWLGGKDRRSISPSADLFETNKPFQDETVEVYQRQFTDEWELFPLLAALLVIWSRSFVVFAAPDILKISFERVLLDLGDGFPLLIAFAAFMGKFAVGFFSDLWNANMFGALAILLSIPAICFSNNPILFLFGVFLINTSTAITLLSAAQSCVGRTGFAFGLTTLALIGGYIYYEYLTVALDWETRLLSLRVFLSALLLVSAIGLYYSTRVLKSRI